MPRDPSRVELRMRPRIPSGPCPQEAARVCIEAQRQRAFEPYRKAAERWNSTHEKRALASCPWPGAVVSVPRSEECAPAARNAVPEPRNTWQWQHSRRVRPSEASSARVQAKVDYRTAFPPEELRDLGVDGPSRRVTLAVGDDCGGDGKPPCRPHDAHAVDAAPTHAAPFQSRRDRAETATVAHMRALAGAPL
jgi:hypothetical protein